MRRSSSRGFEDVTFNGHTLSTIHLNSGILWMADSASSCFLSSFSSTVFSSRLATSHSPSRVVT
jgi:hypothetical protein